MRIRFWEKAFLSLIFVVLSVSLISCKKVKSIDEISAAERTSNNTDIDIDLSNLNYNMISSITFDMLIAPEKYIGKRVKITGKFYTSVYEDERLYSALVWDPTGCCPAGLDFIAPEEMHYPEDFPENDTQICVVGVMTNMKIDDEQYMVFKADEVSVEKM